MQTQSYGIKVHLQLYHEIWKFLGSDFTLPWEGVGPVPLVPNRLAQAVHYTVK